MGASSGDLDRLLEGRQLAVAESCTGGLLAEFFARSEDSSDWFRGGVVVYQRETKFDVLDVTPGPVVTEPVAREMAEGVARLFTADVAVSITGAAGPDPHDGAKPGTVVIGLLVDGNVTATTYSFAGDPGTVCAQARKEAVRMLRTALESVAS